MDTEIAFTDGACSGNPGPGGWAVWMGNELISEFLPWTTNNIAELMAVYKAIEQAEPSIDLTIITDSKNVAGWCTHQFQRNNPNISEIVDLIIDIATVKGIRLSFEVVKGHSNNLGNNKVDRAAQRQAQLGAYLHAAHKV